MGNISIVKSQSDYFIVQELNTLILSPEFIKEMGEPLIYRRGQFWNFAYIDKTMVGFMVYDLGSIIYAYTLPKFRGTRVFSCLFDEVPAYVTKVVASNMSLPIFLKKGFTVVKNFKTCHKLIRK